MPAGTDAQPEPKPEREPDVNEVTFKFVAACVAASTARLGRLAACASFLQQYRKQLGSGGVSPSGLDSRLCRIAELRHQLSSNNNNDVDVVEQLRAGEDWQQPALLFQDAVPIGMCYHIVTGPSSEHLVWQQQQELEEHERHRQLSSVSGQGQLPPQRPQPQTYRPPCMQPAARGAQPPAASSRAVGVGPVPSSGTGQAGHPATGRRQQWPQDRPPAVASAAQQAAASTRKVGCRPACVLTWM